MYFKEGDSQKTVTTTVSVPVKTDTQAFVTLATNDSYALGALVLANSLRQAGTRRQIAILITDQVCQQMRSHLLEV